MLVNKYVCGPEIDEPVRLTRGAGRFYYHQAALGTVTELTGWLGHVRERYEYDVYGQPTLRNNVGTEIPASQYGNRFLFQGRDRDPDTGLYNFRYRTYSPTLGRFLQVDPIRELGGWNLYAFVWNGPQRFVDPFGLVRWGQFFWGMGSFAGGMALALGSMALAVPTGGLSAAGALSAAIAMTYGIGNMAAAFSHNSQAAGQMLNSPSNLGNAVTCVLFHDSGPVATQLGGMFEDGASLILSAGPPHAVLATLQFFVPVLIGAHVFDENPLLYDF